MIQHIWAELTAAAVSILASAFFASTAAAFNAMGELKIKHTIQVKGSSASALNIWLEHPKKMLYTTLLGNVLSNVTTAVSVTILFAVLYPGCPLILVISVVTVLIIILGDIIPRSIAAGNPCNFLILNTKIIKAFFYLLLPLTWSMVKFTSFIYRLSGHEHKVNEPITEEDLAFIIEKQGILEEQKQQMLANIFEIYDTQAKEVMVPRTDMLAFPLDMDKEGIIKLLKENEYSRLPVYEGTLDNIKGVLHVKDLLKLDSGWSLEELMETVHEAKFVPETKKIDVLLREFQRERQQMAIVIDEYGGVAGIITMEDVLEEIVGEIRDEYDADEKEFEVQQLGEGHFRVDAIMNISDFCDYFDLERTDDMLEYDTLGGLVFDIAAAIPSVGDEFKWRNFNITVHSMKNNKLETVDFVRNEPSGVNEDEEDEK